jgi:hypothetical protein
MNQKPYQRGQHGGVVMTTKHTPDASELLEALCNVEVRLSGINYDVYESYVSTSERIADSLRIIRAALAKARGE